jgi:2-phosphosulfolactate phosphatase
MSRRLDVALLPQLARPLEGHVCIVIDVLRASSSIVAMLTAGAEAIWVAPTTDGARVLAQRYEALLCGEEDAFKPEDFAHGNSAAELARLDLRGRVVAFSTTNGTPALAASARAALAVVAGLVNVTAVARYVAARAAALDGHITVLCAGRRGARYVSLEDTYCAGVLVERLLAASDLVPEDAALVARQVARAYTQAHPADPVAAARAVFADAWNGRRLVQIGMAEDVAFCAQVDWSTVVPVLDRVGDDLVIRADG